MFLHLEGRRLARRFLLLVVPGVAAIAVVVGGFAGGGPPPTPRSVAKAGLLRERPFSSSVPSPRRGGVGLFVAPHRPLSSGASQGERGRGGRGGGGRRRRPDGGGGLFGTLSDFGDASPSSPSPTVVAKKEEEEEETLSNDARNNGGGASSSSSAAASADDDADDDVDADVNDVFSKENEEEGGGSSSKSKSISTFDRDNMRKAIQLAQSAGGERGAASPFPKPMDSAIIVTEDGRVIGRGRSGFTKDCVLEALEDAGLVVTPLREWSVMWPSSRELRDDLGSSTLYVTLEPSPERKGNALPPTTQLIELSGIPRVVIGSEDPIPERAARGAAALHSSGLSVTMGVEKDDCEKLIAEYQTLANNKLHRMARKHFRSTGRPLGFLHCSVIDSDDKEAFARHGNAFGKDFGGKHLSFRDFGAYELAPPPEVIWALTDSSAYAYVEDFDAATEVDDDFNVMFEEEDYQESLGRNPMMPWYEQVDAVVATFPKPGNGPSDDDSISARLNGLRWLATHGDDLPGNVERILVMDATDLVDLPLTNDHPSIQPSGVDVESFWKAKNRKPTRILLRHGNNARAIAAAEGAAKAAEGAAKAARMAKDAIEGGDAERAAEAAIECRDAADRATRWVRREMETFQDLKRRLVDMGVTVEIIRGGEPVDVMKHLGERNGYESVVWRAGCWGERGVKSILDGAFQWVSAHLAVDAVGGKFWQLMLAERAVQAACGPESKVKLFAEQEDISLEYCDESEDMGINGEDGDCILTVDGRPVRHVRLDCRVALVDDSRPRSMARPKLKPMKKLHEEEAPWFL